MRRVLLVFLLALSLFLPLIRRAQPVETLKGFRGSLEEVLEELDKELGPFDEKILLSDGAVLDKAGKKIQVLRDNFLGEDYLIFIND